MKPLLLLVLKPGAQCDKQTMLEFLGPRVVKWWLPDDVLIVDEIPHTATGKISKLSIRKMLDADGYKLPEFR